ncbi:MAG TPA: hypothetical protein VIX17_11590 [Pyrinomonadaceae bacterium]
MTDLTRGIYRRIYSGFIEGQRINKLSLQAEAWFWRVLATTDDFGNAKGEARSCWLATVGHRDNITVKHVSNWLQEMVDVGLIFFYEVKGERFLHVTGFEEMQPCGRNGKRIQRFAPPDESRTIQVNPEKSRINVSPDTEEEEDTDTHTEEEKESRSATAVSVFDYWKKESGHVHAHFTDKRRSRVVARLKQGYSAEQLQTAIRGCLASPFHRGQNDTGEKYDDLELICRDGEHVEKFIAISENGGSQNGKPTASQRRIDQLRANAEFLRSGGGAVNRQEPDSGGIATIG